MEGKSVASCFWSGDFIVLNGCLVLFCRLSATKLLSNYDFYLFPLICRAFKAPAAISVARSDAVRVDRSQRHASRREVRACNCAGVAGAFMGVGSYFEVNVFQCSVAVRDIDARFTDARTMGPDAPHLWHCTAHL